MSHHHACHSTATLSPCESGAPRVHSVIRHRGIARVREFLDTYESAPYTCVITVCNGTRLPNLDVHTTRLNISSSEFLQLTRSLLSVLRTSQELCIVAVVADIHVIHALAFIRPSPLLPLPTARVELRGAPRTPAHVKCTSWSRLRRPLESVRASDCIETILIDAQHRLYEGCISNLFFLMNNNSLVTAPDDAVLPGSMRRTVLRVCQQQHISVQLRLLHIDELRRVSVAFLTSVSRLIVPVDAIRHDNKLHCFAECASKQHFVNTMRDLVCDYTVRNAIAVYETGDDTIS